MCTTFLKSGLLSLAIIVFGADSPSFAQSTSQASVQKKPASQAAQTSQATRKAGPFHGKLAALDKTAKTIKVGKRTFQITSKTRINRAGNKATLEDAVLGEIVSGYVKPTEDGKWIATTLNLGPKAKTKAPSQEKSNKTGSEKQGS